ncbi:hypothetical protein GIB67_008843 [Kingdonia uniflora]|uniref:Uncharacterized protein n=1 Tax=Kingdonia uniflora TaxID=39325 RepID=A0A7J7LVF7_9MAGN|nr:hypothetical protein GIB67_008843 [Kingdonia uniflora]
MLKQFLRKLLWKSLTSDSGDPTGNNNGNNAGICSGTDNGNVVPALSSNVLVEFIGSGSAKFTEPVIAATCTMSTINLFKIFLRDYYLIPSSGEADDDEAMFDLEVVYDLLLRVITSSALDAKVAKK